MAEAVQGHGASIPLPFWGISASVAFQSLNGYLTGTAAQAYGGFTAGTGFDNPRGLGTFWLRHAGHDAPTARPPAGGARTAAGQASISVPLVAPETEFTPRINQLDISFSKRVTFGRASLLPKIDFFNALNSDDYSSVSTMQYGAAAYNRPSVILQGRIIRIGVDMTW